MFKVYYTNHWYYASPEFPTFAAAVAHGKKAGFEFSVHEFETEREAQDPYHNRAELIYAWSPIGGARVYSQRYRGVA